MSDTPSNNEVDGNHQRQYAATPTQQTTSKGRKALARDDAKPDRSDQQQKHQSTRNRAPPTDTGRNLGSLRSPTVADVPVSLASSKKTPGLSAPSFAGTQRPSLPHRSKGSKDDKENDHLHLIKKRSNTSAPAKEERHGTSMHHRTGDTIDKIGEGAYAQASVVPRKIDNIDKPSQSNPSGQRRGACSGPSNPGRSTLTAPPNVDARQEANKVKSATVTTKIASSQEEQEEESGLAVVIKENENMKELKTAKRSMVVYFRLKGFVATINDFVHLYEVCDNECKEDLELWTKQVFPAWQHVTYQMSSFIRYIMMLDCPGNHRVSRPLGVVEQIAHTLLDLARQERPMRQKVKQIIMDDHENRRTVAYENNGEGVPSKQLPKRDTQNDETKKANKKEATIRELRDTVRAQSLPVWKKALEGWEPSARSDVEKMQKIVQKRLRAVAEERRRENM